MICLFFLRPAVDAYRVSTNHGDDKEAFDPIFEMFFTKAVELATESIPGCVLQVYVILTVEEGQTLGNGALLSIVISALTTGYASAMISFDSEVDSANRKNMPQFFGYIPDDNKLRGVCFLLMTLIAALHNISRSVGCALLAASGGFTMVFSFVGGEILIFLLWKIVRRDYMYWVPINGVLGVVVSLLARVICKIVVDFSGCLQLR